MKRLYIYTFVISAIFGIGSFAFLSASIADHKKAQKEPAQVIEVASNKVEDTEVEETVVDEQQTLPDVDTDIDMETEEPNNKPVEDSNTNTQSGYEKNPLFDDSMGEVITDNIRPTPKNVGLPEDCYNTDYDTDKMEFYMLDDTVKGSSNISAAEIMESLFPDDQFMSMIEDHNLKPYYTEFTGTTDIEQYTVYFRNADLCIPIWYDDRDEMDVKWERLQLAPASQQDAIGDEYSYDKPIIVYKYLSRYNQEVMEPIESKLDMEDFSTALWWSDYQFGDSEANFYQIDDLTGKDPITVKVDVWR